MNELTKHSGVVATLPGKPQSVADYQSLGALLSSSGYFSDARDAAQAAVKVMAGAELGIPPIAAMMGIHIIKGKVALGAHLIASRIKAHGYGLKILKMDNAGCEIQFVDRDGKSEIGRSSFTEEDAKAAQVYGDMYKKFPRNMYYSRAISNGAKWFTPEVFGGAPIYTPEELGAKVDNDGEIIPETRDQVLQRRMEEERTKLEAQRKFKAADEDLPNALGGTHPQEPSPIDEQRRAEIRASIAKPSIEKPWSTFREMLDVFAGLREKVGDDSYYSALKNYGVEHANQFTTATKNDALDCFAELKGIAEAKEAGVIA